MGLLPQTYDASKQWLVRRQPVKIIVKILNNRFDPKEMLCV